MTHLATAALTGGCVNTEVRIAMKMTRVHRSLLWGLIVLGAIFPALGFPVVAFADGPSLTISSTTVVPGQQVAISGDQCGEGGYIANVTVAGSSPYDTVADGNGNWTSMFTVPLDTPTGTLDVSANCRDFDNFPYFDYAGQTLDVVSPKAPSITSQPTNATARPAHLVTFTVAASGEPVPTIQWQVSTDQGRSWTDIPMATSATYTIEAVTIGQSGSQFRAVATNSVGSSTSDPVALTVTAPPQLPVTGVNDTGGIAAATLLFFGGVALMSLSYRRQRRADSVIS